MRARGYGFVGFVVSALLAGGTQMVAQQAFAGVVASGATTTSSTITSSSLSTADKYVWLEDVSSERSMNWVRAEDARTVKVLESDPRYAAYQADALKIAEDPRRLRC